MVKKRKKESIFVSPDGGETVYEQLPNGDRILVEQSQRATLQKAWDKYRTVWHLITGNQ